MPTAKCYQCGSDSSDQAFCGACGSPLSLNDYLSKKVRDQLADTIRDRDVLEMDSSIKVFKQAWDWIKLIFGIATGLLVLGGAGVLWKTSDFWSSVDKAKQSVIDTASLSKQDISKTLDVGKATINAASHDAVLQSQAFKETTVRTQAGNAR